MDRFTGGLKSCVRGFVGGVGAERKREAGRVRVKGDAYREDELIGYSRFAADAMACVVTSMFCSFRHGEVFAAASAFMFTFTNCEGRVQ